MNEQQFTVNVIGHGHIEDDLGNVLLDKYNAVHPQNLARIFARALSHEHNYYISRIAFGNGGTTVDAAYTITYNVPNDGQSPDTATWDSRIYNETFSKIIDSGQDILNPLLGVDPGSADSNGIRPGGGSVPSADPTSILHISGPGVRSVDLGLTSEVVISATINASEPLSQSSTDTLSPTENTEANFVFDEIGLYTSGAQALASNGYQYINVGNKTSTSSTGLAKNAAYSFNVTIDGGTVQTITFTTPTLGGSGSSGEILYGDLCEAINTGDPTWLATPITGGTMSITDDSGGLFSTLVGDETTYGFLRFTSNTQGASSSVSLTGAQTTAFLNSIAAPTIATVEAAVPGTEAGLQNAPTNSTTERERLLAHLIFSPILKAANRVLNITYTLTISVGRTPSQVGA